MYSRCDNPTIRVRIIDKTKQQHSHTYFAEFLQDIKGSEIIVSKGDNPSKVCLSLDDHHFLKLNETLYSQGVRTGSKLYSKFIVS